MAAKRFYNPGPAITETVRFDKPFNDKESNTVAYHHLSAPEAGFFEVPSVITINQEGGEAIEVPTQLPTIIRQQFRKQGFVMVDPSAKIKPGDNVVKTDKEAIALGNEMLEEDLYETYREHERICLERKNAGLKPKRATGRVAWAINRLGVEDPANDIEDVVKRKQDQTEVDKLKEQLEEMKRLVMNLATAKGK